jgi:glycosyltransferase involved in cell wall biosynthesis
VVIPTFNRAALLRQTLDSVQTQDYRPLEVIVVDDGSTDATAAMLADYNMPGLRALRGAHVGAAAARNRGAAASRGEFIMFVDSDDLLHAGAVAALVAGIGKADLCFGRWRDWFSDETPQRYSEPYQREAGDDVLASLLRHEWLLPSAVLHRRSSLARTAGWDESFTIEDDFAFMMRVAQSGAKAAAVSAVVADYRRHSGAQLGKAAYAQKAAATERVLRLVEAQLDAGGWNQARREAMAWRWFWEARMAWDAGADAERFEALVAEAQRVLPGFRPPKVWYRWIASLAGYPAAERVAGLARRLLK